MNKHTKIILEKQFEIIGQEFSEDYVKRPDWFQEHTWTEKQENEFGEWLWCYMRKNKDAREELMNSPNKQFTESFARHWILNFGWKVLN